MKVGDLVRFYGEGCQALKGCLPYLESNNWGCGLVQELSKDKHGREDGDVLILWPDQGTVLVDKRMLEVINENR